MPDMPPPPEEPQDLAPWPEEAPAEAPAPASPPARAAHAADGNGAGPQPLSDLHAERALLGAVLLNPDMYFEVATLVGERDFTFLAHRHIWKAIADIVQQHQSVDVAVLAAELRRRELLDEVGGPAYLSELLTSVDRSLSAPHYARLVADYSLRRQLQATAQEIVRLVHRTDLDGDTVLSEAERLLFRISSHRERREVQPLAQVLEALQTHLQHIYEHEGVAGIPTGFRPLDDLLKGLQPSDLIIIAGRPGMGKTAFLVSIALHAARQGKHVALFSLEMSNEQVAQRMLSQETGFGADLFRDPRRLRPDQWRRLDAAVEALSTLPVFLDDTPALTPQQLRVKCMRLQQQYGLDMVVVDYLQLMSGGRRNENRVQEVSYISRSLKHLARDLNLPVVAAAQLSRAVEQRPNKRPMLSDLRESGALEQDADVVIFLYREEYYAQQGDENEDGQAQRRKRPSRQPEKVEVIVAKHRNGPTATIEMIFEPWRAAFKEGRLAPNVEEVDLSKPRRPSRRPLQPPSAAHGLTDEVPL